MRLFQDMRGISKLVLILLLLFSFVLGATLSYIWTMGFYAPSEYHLPKKANVTIENVQFFPDDATSFNVTVLNPSYSSNVTIEQVNVETADGKLHNTTLQSSPISLARGTSQTIKSFWNWGNYTGQTLDIIVLLSEGSGATLKASTPYMNFAVTNVNLNSSLSVNHFNITVHNAGSSTFVNITKILVNGAEVSTAPNLTSPYGLTNASAAPAVTFMLMRNWTDLQGKTVAIAVQTLQGYTAYQTTLAPSPMLLRITDIDFNINYTDHFNLTVQNSENSPPGFVNINATKLLIENRTITPIISPALPQKLQWNSSITLTYYWNWASYEGNNVTIVILTLQGFTISNTTIIPKLDVSFSTIASTKYTMGIEIATTPDAVDGQTSVIP